MQTDVRIFFDTADLCKVFPILSLALLQDFVACTHLGPESYDACVHYTTLWVLQYFAHISKPSTVDNILKDAHMYTIQSHD